MALRTGPEAMTDEAWQAIRNNDPAYDGKFWYAVRTTRIFCRPSCKSRPPKLENSCVFRTVEQAMEAGFRPCKRCKPTGLRLPDEEWIGLITDYIDKHYMEALTLGVLAEIGHGSPYHLHRVFHKITGKTPVDYIQQKRIEQAKERLTGSDQSIAEIGQSVGLANTPYFITLFKKKTGHTPAGYRQLHNRMTGEEHIDGN
ncbi:bifunctional transcriptional activator/DNA repair enzyme AdaA [Paenibacillus filicis]|uniref:Bifunctional transcriptional activator/DNA repair enzyme AdaA n=1 Tax=Paenibacillus filicis TaxID=669464 RepID=A0ABU9DP45_9BACL